MFHKSKQSIKLCVILASLFSATSLIACNSGGSSNGGGGGGDNSDATVSTLTTLSNSLASAYHPNCMYLATDHQWNLVKSDGSGAGVQVNTATGAVTALSNQPQINPSDSCLVGSFQLDWVTTESPLVVHALDISGQKALDLSATGLSATQIQNTSFSTTMEYHSSSDTWIANSNFVDSSFGASSFTGDSPSSYTNIVTPQVNSLYKNALPYGFMGNDGHSFTQVVSAVGTALPAELITLDSRFGVVSQVTLTDAKGQAIPAMDGIWDITSGSNGLVVVTGLVQPTFWSCQPASQDNFHCTTSYTSQLLRSKYKVLRTLGAGSNYVIFFGLDLAHQSSGIYKITFKSANNVSSVANLANPDIANLQR